MKRIELVGSVQATVDILAGPSSDIPDYCRMNSSDGCAYYYPEDLVYPYQGSMNSFFLTTKIVTRTYSTANCTRMTGNCPKVLVKEEKQYIAGIENTVLMLDHAVRAQFSPGFLQTYDYRIATTREMRGKLLGCGSEKRVLVNYEREDEVYRMKGSTSDRIPFQFFLQAVNCSGVGSGLMRKVDGVEGWRDQGMIVSCTSSFFSFWEMRLMCSSDYVYESNECSRIQ